MSDITISVGTELHVSANAPATYDAAGYAALAYTEVGEVGSIPTFGGQSQVTEFIPIKTGVVDKRKGSTNYGSTNITAATVLDDVGQVAMKSGFDGANEAVVHSFKIFNAAIGTIYYSGIITSFQYNLGDANTITQSETTIELTTEPVIVAAA